MKLQWLYCAMCNQDNIVLKVLWGLRSCLHSVSQFQSGLYVWDQQWLSGWRGDQSCLHAKISQICQTGHWVKGPDLSTMVIVRVTATMHWWSVSPCRLSFCLCVCRYWVEVQGEHAGKVLIGAHFCCCVLASEEPVCHPDTKVIVCVCVWMPF